MGLSLLAIFGSKKADWSGSGPLAVLTLAFVAGLQWRKETPEGQKVSGCGYVSIFEWLEMGMFVLHYRKLCQFMCQCLYRYSLFMSVCLIYYYMFENSLLKRWNSISSWDWWVVFKICTSLLQCLQYIGDIFPSLFSALWTALCVNCEFFSFQGLKLLLILSWMYLDHIQTDFHFILFTKDIVMR